jgi:hypothetical protein
LDCPLDWENPKLVAAEDAVAAAAARHQIAWGRPGGGPAQIKRIAAKGGKLIAHGSDFGALMSMLPTYAKAFNEAIPGRNNAATPRHHEA